MGRRFLGLTTAARLRVKDCPAGNEYKYRLLVAAVGRPPIFQGAHHRCEAAYKICGKAATTTPPPFGTAYHLSTRKRWHIEPSGQRPVNPKNLPL